MAYIHGYNSEEQNRLMDQARHLEYDIYGDIDMSKVSKLLEVGCGVGAQTEILLRRFPHLQIIAIDISEKQLSLARDRLVSYIDKGCVQFIQANAMELINLDIDKDIDGVFVCWFLEHVSKPQVVLSNIRKIVRPSSPIWITEVNNSSFFIDPYSPNILKYWMEMNDYQWSIQGHPFVGLQLGNYFLESGYQDIKIDIRNFYFDSRDPKGRNEFMGFFLSLLKSASQNLVAEGRVTEELVDIMDQELVRVLEAKHSLIQYGWVRGLART